MNDRLNRLNESKVYPRSVFLTEIRRKYHINAVIYYAIKIRGILQRRVIVMGTKRRGIESTGDRKRHDLPFDVNGLGPNQMRNVTTWGRNEREP